MQKNYPSIERPWLKYYPEDAIKASLPECTLYEYLWENNKDHLSEIAMKYYGTVITFDRFFSLIHRAANAFYSMGVRAGDAVTIMSMHTPETIASLYALNYIGAVANIVYITLSDKEIIDTLEKTNSKLLVILDIALSQVIKIQKSIRCPTIVIRVSGSMALFAKTVYGLKYKTEKHDFLTWEYFLDEGKETAEQRHDGFAPAIIVYTSGSTGVPKGVELSCYNINSVAFQYRYVDCVLERGDTNLVFIPPFFSMGICYLHMPLCRGCCLIICVNPEPQNVVKEFIKHRPNHFVAAPSNILMLTEKKVENLDFLRSFGAGGEAVSFKTERKINQWLKNNGAKVKLSIGYGMTEFSATVVLNSDSANKENTLGIPLVKTNVKIIDTDTGKEMSYNQVGEMCFHTPSQMKGYIGQDEENKRVIEDFGDGVKWVHTGDLGYIDEDGFLHYSGRIKRIFITKTKLDTDAVLMKMFPQKIEECIVNISFVKCCGVIVKDDAEKIHIPIAYVVLNNDSISHQEAIRIIQETIEKELPKQEWPEMINIIDDMPVTLNGKIDYKRLEVM